MIGAESEVDCRISIRQDRNPRQEIRIVLAGKKHDSLAALCAFEELRSQRSAGWDHVAGAGEFCVADADLAALDGAVRDASSQIVIVSRVQLERYFLSEAGGKLRVKLLLSRTNVFPGRVF